jgi:hypothetical protein
MTDGARPPISRRMMVRVMPVIFRIVNVPMRLILSLPTATPLGKRLMLVYLTGRKSGRHYRQPISHIRDGETLLTPGGGKWKLNLIESEPTDICLGAEDVSLRAELVRDPDEVERLLGVMSAKNPMVSRFVPIPKREGHSTANGSTSRFGTASASFAGRLTTHPRERRSCARAEGHR